MTSDSTGTTMQLVLLVEDEAAIRRFLQELGTTLR